jgi:hypothetical protein
MKSPARGSYGALQHRQRGHQYYVRHVCRGINVARPDWFQLAQRSSVLIQSEPVMLSVGLGYGFHPRVVNGLTRRQWQIPTSARVWRRAFAAIS